MEDIHLEGGTVLGTCEAGECNVMEVVKRLGERGAAAGWREHARAELLLAVDACLLPVPACCSCLPAVHACLLSVPACLQTCGPSTCCS